MRQRQVVSGQLPHHKLQWTMVWQLKPRGDKSVHEREQVYLIEFPGRGDVGKSSDGSPVWKFDGCLETLPVSLSEMPDLTVLMWFSDKPERCLRWQACGQKYRLERRKNSRYFQGNLSKLDPEEMEYRWLRSGSGSWLIEAVPMSHRSLLLKCHGRWELPTPSQLTWWQLKSPHLRKSEFGWEDAIGNCQILHLRTSGRTLPHLLRSSPPSERWEGYIE